MDLLGEEAALGEVEGEEELGALDDDAGVGAEERGEEGLVDVVGVGVAEVGDVEADGSARGGFVAGRGPADESEAAERGVEVGADDGNDFDAVEGLDDVAGAGQREALPLGFLSIFLGVLGDAEARVHVVLLR